MFTFTLANAIEAGQGGNSNGSMRSAGPRAKKQSRCIHLRHRDVGITSVLSKTNLGQVVKGVEAGLSGEPVTELQT